MDTVQRYDPIPQIAEDLGLAAARVAAAVALFDAGNTVPFVARYRKERTGSLDEVQLRAIEERRGDAVRLDAELPGDPVGGVDGCARRALHADLSVRTGKSTASRPR